MRLAPGANSDVRWIKSSYSGGSGSDCVEMAVSDHVMSIRDSKNPEPGVLALKTDAFSFFVECVKVQDDIRGVR